MGATRDHRLRPLQDGIDHYGESGRSGVGRIRNVVAPTSLAGQFEQLYGPMGPPTLFTSVTRLFPVLCYAEYNGCRRESFRLNQRVPTRSAGRRNDRRAARPLLWGLDDTAIAAGRRMNDAARTTELMAQGA